MDKSQVAQITGPIWDTQQLASTPPITPRSTLMSASGRAHTPYAKNSPTHQDNTDTNTDPASGPRHAKRLKRLQVVDMLCEQAVENQHLLSTEVHSDILQPAPEEMSPTSRAQEQGQRRVERGFYPTASEKSPVLHGQVFECSGYPSDPVNHNGSQSGSTEQPTSDAAPIALLEDRQTLRQQVDSFESITVEVAGRTVDQEDSSSQRNQIDSCVEERNLSAAQPVIEPVEATDSPITSDKEQQIAWASQQVKNFKAEIQKLKNDAASRTRNITSIEQDIENFQRQYNKLLHDAEEEIMRIVREAEKQQGAFESKLLHLKESKQNELRIRERYVLEASRKENGLLHFQAIVEYYNHEEGNDDE